MGAVLERFTSPAREAVLCAREEANALEHGYVGSEHLVLGLVGAQDGVAARVLAGFGVGVEGAREEVANVARPEPIEGQASYTRPAIKVLELALREVLAFCDPRVGTAHMLLGLTRSNDDVAEQLLTVLGAAPAEVAAETLRLRSGPGGIWKADAWAERGDAHATPHGEARTGPLRATAVRAAVEVAIVAGATKAADEGRYVDLGDLVLALAQGWPDDIPARALKQLGVDPVELSARLDAARSGRA